MQDVRVIYQHMYQSISVSMNFLNQDHQTLARCVEYFSKYDGEQSDAEETFPSDIKKMALHAVNNILLEPSRFNKLLRTDWLKDLPTFMQPEKIPDFPEVPKLKPPIHHHGPARAPAPPTPRDLESPKQNNALPIKPSRKGRRASTLVKKKLGFFASSLERDKKGYSDVGHKNEQSRSI